MNISWFTRETVTVKFSENCYFHIFSALTSNSCRFFPHTKVTYFLNYVAVDSLCHSERNDNNLILFYWTRMYQCLIGWVFGLNILVWPKCWDLCVPVLLLGARTSSCSFKRAELLCHYFLTFTLFQSVTLCDRLWWRNPSLVKAPCRFSFVCWLFLMLVNFSRLFCYWKWALSKCYGD